MNFVEFNKLFKEKCESNHIIYDEIKSELLYKYMTLILEWNNKINLTAIKDEREFIVKHFIDSLTINEFIDDYNQILDIGTGAGFPGIPIKIYNAKSEITLIDSVNKKINVINDIICKLKLEKIEAIHIRAEELAKDTKYRESFDIVTTRAVSKLSTIVEYMLPFVKIGGKAICMKGPNVEQELEDSKNAIEILGGKVEKIKKINIDNEFERNIIIIRKNFHTNIRYPREQGKPLKEPLK